MTEQEPTDHRELRFAGRGRSVESRNGGQAKEIICKAPASPLGVSDADARDVGLRSLSDQELLEHIQSGSERHFNELYGRYFHRIYNFVYARIRNHADAEEVVQETFTAVFRSIDSYRGQSSLLSWIYGIAKNTVNNTLRRAKLHESRLQQMDSRQVRSPETGLIGSPEEELSMSRCVSAIREQLESIGQWQAEIFVMRHVQDLSIKEISERTERSSDSVRSSLYRVKRLLVEATGLEATAAIR